MSTACAPKIRWGILGTADIARKNWLAILNSGNSTVVAVASRTLRRAEDFVRTCQSHASTSPTPKAFGSYEELLKCKEVEAVYIPLPTGVRKEWVLRAATAGKHALCEKPCAPTLKELEEMLEVCRQHQVQFSDGVMFMHSRRLERMRMALDDAATFGSLRRITSAFSFRAPPEFFSDNIRAQPDLEPLGCLGDLGWYCIRFSLWAMNWQSPERVVGQILSQFELPNNPKGVLTEFSGELLFSGGISAGFYCSFLAHNQQWAQVSGTNGYLRLEDFVVPFAGDRIGFAVYNHQFLKSGCEFKMQAGERHHSIAERSHGDPTAQETNLFREFAHQLRSGRLNNDWPDFARQTQKVMEACLESARAGCTRQPLAADSSKSPA